MCYLAFGLGFLLGFAALVLIGLLLERAEDRKRAATAKGHPPAQSPFLPNSLLKIEDLSDEYLHDLEGMMQHLLSKGERKR